MAIDGLSLYAVTHELQSLVGSRIDKVQQPDKDMIVLHLHGADCGRVKLLLNIHAENGRLQLTNSSYENPMNAPAFCMLLRKYLIGCRITEVYQAGLNRIAGFRLQGKNELQDTTSLRLVVELMGRHGNIFLLSEDGRIIDCIRHFGIGEDCARVCVPNVTYQQPPSPERLHPFFVSEAVMHAQCGGRHPSEWMVSSFHGISRLCAQQLVASEASAHRIVSECMDTFSQLSSGQFHPSVVVGSGVLPFAPKNAEFLSFSTMSEAFDAFYQFRDEQAILTKKRTALRTATDNALKRCRKNLAACNLQILEEDKIQTYRLYGELLMMHLHSLKGTRSDAVVMNYYEDPPTPLSIPLDKRYTVQENAERYFKQYRKSKTAREYALERMEHLRSEQDYLEGLLYSIEQCTSFEELREMQEELTQGGYRKERTAASSARTGSRSVPLLYRASDGTRIWVGKNNRQNEQLLRSALPNHLWLHAKGVPASHVIVECESPTSETLLLAAQIAALHSKAASSANVAVDYTQRKHVKKPSGSRPGFVNYFHQHTLYVTPDATVLKQHLESH